MQKKIIALCALLTSVPYVSADYPATQGYQADSHHHKKMSDEDRKAIQDYDQEIRDLRKEIEKPHWKSNGCAVVALIGAGAWTISYLTSDNKNNNNNNNPLINLGNVGGAAAVTFGSVGAVLRYMEIEKVKEYNKIIENRLDRADSIRNKNR